MERIEILPHRHENAIPEGDTTGTSERPPSVECLGDLELVPRRFGVDRAREREPRQVNERHLGGCPNDVAVLEVTTHDAALTVRDGEVQVRAVRRERADE